MTNQEKTKKINKKGVKLRTRILLYWSIFLLVIFFVFIFLFTNAIDKVGSDIQNINSEFMLNQSKEYLAVFNRIGNTDFVVSDIIKNDDIFSASKVMQAEINKSINDYIFYFILPTGVIFFIVVFIFVFFFSSRITRSLAKMNKIVKRVIEGRWRGEKIIVTSMDEMGKLAGSFNKMIEKLDNSDKKLAEYNKNLEKEVESKTKELRKILAGMQDEKKSLDNQRLATLNILEDVNESGDELKKINVSLEKKKAELEALRSLSVELTGVLDIKEAIRVFSTYLSELLDFSVAVYVITNLEEDGGLAYMTYLNEEVSEDCLNVIKKNLLKYLAKQPKTKLGKAINIIKNIKSYIFGSKLNNTKNFELKQEVIYPLMVGSEILGVIQIVSCRDDGAVDVNKDLVDAMLTNFSLAISRLQTIARSQNSKTGSLIESLSDGVVMFNSEKNIVLINPRARKYMDFSAENPSLNDIYAVFEKIDFADKINLALLEGKIFHIDEAVLSEYYYEIFVIPVKDMYDKIVGGAIILHDVTAFKKIDKIKTEFVSVASHQLRTPLTAIKLFTDMLVRGEVGKLNKDQTEYLHNIYESTERMVHLVNDLLNVTRMESGKLRTTPEPTVLKDFVKAIIVEAKPLAKSKKVKIDFISDNDLTKIPLDQNLMRQVIHNLLVNAVRYSKIDGGKIIVEVKRKDKNLFLITVKDNGIGIPGKMQGRIFEKFFRADNAIKSVTEGTGLGLYVSKMIVESSGGKVWFESKKNKGTCFFVEIPVKGMKMQEGERGLAIS